MFLSDNISENSIHQDFFFSHYKNKKRVDHTDIMKIKKYLFEKDEFFHYEFTLFNNYLKYFNVEFVKELTKTSEKYLSEIENIPEYNLEKIIFFKNLTYYYLENNLLKEAKDNFYILEQLVNKNIVNISVLLLYQYKFIRAILSDQSITSLLSEANSLGMHKLTCDIENLLSENFR